MRGVACAGRAGAGPGAIPETRPGCGCRSGARVREVWGRRSGGASQRAKAGKAVKPGGVEVRSLRVRGPAGGKRSLPARLGAAGGSRTRSSSAQHPPGLGKGALGRSRGFAPRKCCSRSDRNPNFLPLLLSGLQIFRASDSLASEKRTAALTKCSLVSEHEKSAANRLVLILKLGTPEGVSPC